MKGRTKDIATFFGIVAAVILLNVFFSSKFKRFDLTEDQKYSLSTSTKSLLDRLEMPMHITVYLHGEFRENFQQLEYEVRQKLQEIQAYGGSMFSYEFVDPLAGDSTESKKELVQDIIKKGIRPFSDMSQRDGKQTQSILFPGAIIHYNQKQLAVNFITNPSQNSLSEKSRSVDEKIGHAINELEYVLAVGLKQIMTKASDAKNIAFLQGHNEANEAEVNRAFQSLRRFYNVGWLNLGDPQINSVDQFVSANPQINVDAMVVCKPKSAFSEKEKFLLDQYIMKGGKVLFFVDAVETKMDTSGLVGLPYKLNLNDLFFRYGFRINENMVRDLQSAPRAVEIGNNLEMRPWTFNPIISTFNEDHVVSKNISPVMGYEMNTIDTVKSKGLTKTPIMFSSKYSNVRGNPITYSTADLNLADTRTLDTSQYPMQHLPLAYFIEGAFQSHYKTRPIPAGINSKEKITVSPQNRIFVCADGDIIMNRYKINEAGKTVTSPLGYSFFERKSYGNDQLLLNIVDYMVDETGIFDLRGKDVELRKLDPMAIDQNAERRKWQIVNIIVPILIIALFGIGRAFVRKRKYTTNSKGIQQ